ncbi:hypothetical protein [Desulfovibrio porci]|uniref:hypothetical protein n=1 Tax=Desulfovibrio porci TaxID=2605782 RepID=UPI001E642CBD|nr:hypothetical protein [Desulfovibrio porci]
MLVFGLNIFVRRKGERIAGQHGRDGQSREVPQIVSIQNGCAGSETLGNKTVQTEGQQHSPGGIIFSGFEQRACVNVAAAKYLFLDGRVVNGGNFFGNGVLKIRFIIVANMQYFRWMCLFRRNNDVIERSAALPRLLIAGNIYGIHSHAVFFQNPIQYGSRQIHIRCGDNPLAQFYGLFIKGFDFRSRGEQRGFAADFLFEKCCCRLGKQLESPPHVGINFVNIGIFLAQPRFGVPAQFDEVHTVGGIHFSGQKIKNVFGVQHGTYKQGIKNIEADDLDVSIMQHVPDMLHGDKGDPGFAGLAGRRGALLISGGQHFQAFFCGAFQASASGKINAGLHGPVDENGVAKICPANAAGRLSDNLRKKDVWPLGKGSKPCARRTVDI